MKARIILVMVFILFAYFNTDAKMNTNEKVDEGDRREHFYKSKDSFSAYEIRYKGKITLSADEKNITSISPDGYLKITKSSFGNSRTIDLKSDSKGNIIAKNIFKEELSTKLAELLD